MWKFLAPKVQSGIRESTMQFTNFTEPRNRSRYRPTLDSFIFFLSARLQRKLLIRQVLDVFHQWFEEEDERDAFLYLKYLKLMAQIYVR